MGAAALRLSVQSPLGAAVFGLALRATPAQQLPPDAVACSALRSVGCGPTARPRRGLRLCLLALYSAFSDHSP